MVYFICDTQEGYIIKVLCELLQQCIPNVCFDINNDGIFSRNTDAQSRLLINLNLLRDNFTTYEFESSSEENNIYLGVNIGNMFKMIKSIKKKDSIQLNITEDNPDKISILVKHKDNNRITMSSITTTHTQHINIAFPLKNDKPIVVSAADCQRAIKEITNIGRNMKVISNNSSIIFKSDDNGIFSKEIILGKESDKPMTYEYTFSNNQISKLTKLSNLSSNVQIFPYENGTLKFKMCVGSLGFIEIYIKSNEQLVTTTDATGEDSDCEE